MKKNALILWLVLFCKIIFAQNFRHPTRCYTDELYQQQIAASPALKTAYEAAANQTKQLANNILSPKEKFGSSAPLYIVPVVVHVVYNTATENISDTAIYTQIQRLNEDYRRINFDTSNTRAIFKNVAADTKIEFRLAVRDPNGNASNGILRTATSAISFSTNNDVKHSSTGGDDAWDECSYLNIWVCNLAGGVLGYAQYPGGAAATDGVVILFSSFGQKGVAEAPYNLGRTVTHEVGHWLNLYHPFQNGCEGMTDSTCMNEGDLCCDTPPIEQPDYGCPSPTSNTCNESYLPRVDMWEDYMDYTDDACMNAFTNDQKARMEATLAGVRSCISNSNALKPVANSTPVLSVNRATICAGKSVTLTATGANNFYWTPYTGLNKTTSASVIASPSVTTIYTIYGTDTTCHCINWILDTIVVAASTANLQISPNSFCASLHPLLTASGAKNYLWSPSSGISNFTKDTATANFNATSTYNILIRDTVNGLACVSSKNITITVQPLPDAAFNIFGDGSALFFTPKLSATNSFVWNFGDGNFSKEQNVNHTFSNNANYVVCLKATTPLGCVDSFCKKISLPYQNISFMNSLMISPNPAKETFLVSFQLNNSTQLKMQVVDVLGRNIATIANDNFAIGYYQLPINCALWSSGTYFLRIESGEGNVVKKLSKQ